MTREEVEHRRKAYEKALETYHQERSTVIRFRDVPDEYRGDISCIRLLDKVERGETTGDGQPYFTKIYKNGVEVGRLVEYFGSNGRGKLAASHFEPRPGVTMKRVD